MENPKITVIGSTGLIGHQVLSLAAADESMDVTAITRREISSLKDRAHIKQVIHNFEALDDLQGALTTDVFVCCLGTTIKTAGSRERFYAVDHDIPLTLAKLAKEQGCGNMILVSSVGADASSKIFYSRVKGELEADLIKLDFDSLHILRPSMLLGERQESRPGEFVGKLIMEPLSALIPWKYKPIQAQVLASKIVQLCTEDRLGVFIHEGKPLFSGE